jgi:hypothetical protein
MRTAIYMLAVVLGISTALGFSLYIITKQAPVFSHKPLRTSAPDGGQSCVRFFDPNCGCYVRICDIGG